MIRATCIVFVATFVVGFVWLLEACGAEAAQRDAVRASYATDLQLCVQDASTREGADECRKNVDKRYGVDAGVNGAHR